MHLLKLCFYFKIKKDKERSLAHTVSQEISINMRDRDNPLLRTPPLTEIKNILKKYKIEPTHNQYFQMPKEEIEPHLRQIIKYNQNKKIIHHLTKQCKHWTPYDIQLYLPNRDTDTGLATHLNNQHKTRLYFDYSYIPKIAYNKLYKIIQTLTQSDHNKKWYLPTECDDCKNFPKFKRLHQIFHCHKHNIQRKLIMDSIITELAYYRDKYNNNQTEKTDIIPNYIYETIQDAAESGSVQPDHFHLIIETLLGAHTDKNLQEKYYLQINKMLASHLYLITNIDTEITINDTQITEIKHNNNIIKFATQDIKAGKIIVRQIIDNIIYHRNIRELIESLTITELENYNLGLGAATTRTSKQKKLAQKYTNRVISEIVGIMINTDGSIHSAGQKVGGYGGIGIVITDINTKTDIQTLKFSIPTNDPQQTEIKGIKESLKYIQNNYHHITHTDNYTILCDCKCAVNYTNNTYNAKDTYSEDLQEIQELITNLTIINKLKIKIKWIPGHTDNKWNDKADSLAKEAAAEWLTELDLPVDRAPLGVPQVLHPHPGDTD